MEMDEIIEEIMDRISDFDADCVHSEGLSDEEREEIAEATRDRAEMKINERAIEARIEQWGGDVEEAIVEYAEEIIRDAYHETLMSV